MALPHIDSRADGHHELRFDSLFHEGRGLAFPCDRSGRVDIERLADRARTNYFYARALVGREYACPVICAARV